MSKFKTVVLAFLAARAVFASEVNNPVFSFTHLLSGPFTLPAGTFVYGTELGYGVTDFLQVGTDLWRDLSQVYNVNAKISFVDAPLVAFALIGEYVTYNLNSISDLNPDVSVRSWRPGAVVAFELLPRTAFFLGGQLNFTDTHVNSDAIVTSGSVRGAMVNAEFAWAYNPPKKRQRVSNALVAGVSYDVTYELFGFGMSHHWPGFKLGFHYYPQADERKIQPLLAGGGVIYF